MSAPRKLLLVAEAVTLAHVGRSIQLATILHRHGLDVVLACDARYGRFLADLPFETVSIESVSSQTFLDALAKGRPVYSSTTLANYVTHDLALLESIRPDAVVGDFRLSLSVSARVARIPYLNVTNAYWSPYARPDFTVPDLPLARLVGVAFAQAAFTLVRPLAFAVHAMPMNRVRREYGLTPFRLDMREVYCDGDLTLYADLPELIPVFGAPPTHRYIGPVLWSPPVEPPPWWSEVIEGEPPLYVSLGSSGAASLLSSIVDTLRPLGRPIVVATAGRCAELQTQRGVWVTDYLSGEAIAAKACAVVCNGGSPATQQALANGVPVLGIASNLDQYLNMGYIQRFGAGITLRADQAHSTMLRGGAHRVIEDSQIRSQAQRVAALFTARRAEVEFPKAVETLLAGPSSAPRA